MGCTGVGTDRGAGVGRGREKGDESDDGGGASCSTSCSRCTQFSLRGAGIGPETTAAAYMSYRKPLEGRRYMTVHITITDSDKNI